MPIAGSRSSTRSRWSYLITAFLAATSRVAAIELDLGDESESKHDYSHGVR